MADSGYAKYSGLGGGGGGGGSGTVTSVALTVPSALFTTPVSGSPVTTSGTLAVALSTQSANTVFAGPSSGAAATPTFRSLVIADLPASIPLTQLASQAAQTVVANATSGSASPTAVALGTVTEATSSVLTLTGWADATIGSPSITVKQASTSQSGYLSSTDWNTFNGKQASGNYITALTGDGTASGPGSAALTLATVNTNTGSFGGASSVPSFTVNGKGLITAASATAVIAPAGTLSGTTLNATVVSSSLTSVGTIATGTWQGTAVGATYGGTGISTAASTGVPVIASGTWSVDSTLPVSLGGTGSGSALTQYGVKYGSTTTAEASTAAGTTGQVLMATTSAAPAFNTLPGNTSILKVPTIQKFLTTGSTTGYLFTISTSTTCAAGDTYTNNSVTFTVLAALSAQSGQVLFTSSSGAPTSTGTLTRATGSGTSSITFTAEVALGTYTLPSPSPLYLKVRLAGGGGGGGGSGTGSDGSGGAGGSTVFGSNLLSATGGSGAVAGIVQGGAGGTASLGTGPIGIALSGGSGGGSGSVLAASAAVFPGSNGGSNLFGGAGGGGIAGAGNGSGQAAASNTGGGGGGGGAGNNANDNSGGGGGAGGFLDAIISSPSSTYPYSIGSGGSGGVAGTNGNAGGNGGSGIIEVIEYYQ